MTISISTVQFLAPTVCATEISQLENLTGLPTIRDAFPILKTNGDKIFFDNAATTQKPVAVLEKIEEFNRTTCANAGRGTYSWSTKLSRAVEETRLAVADFIHTDPDLVAFTHGA